MTEDMAQSVSVSSLPFLHKFSAAALNNKKIHLPEIKIIINLIWNMVLKIRSMETMSKSWMEEEISESNSKDK